MSLALALPDEVRSGWVPGRRRLIGGIDAPLVILAGEITREVAF